MDQLILASTSPYRKQLLESRGLSFRAIAPLCNEDELKLPHLSASQLTLHLAKAKAESLTEVNPQAMIIGCDQVLEFKNKIYGKPNTKERALEQLLELQGQCHQLVTSIYIHSPIKTFSHTEVVSLKMHPWSTEELEKYIELDQPLDCAGSYKLEKRGLILFERISADDYESIIGIPLISLFNFLKKEGFPFFK